MSVENVGDEIAGRIEAISWFMLDLADELAASGWLDRQQFLQRLRRRDDLEDQLEYVRIAQQRIGRLAEVFAAQGADRKPAS